MSARDKLLSQLQELGNGILDYGEISAFVYAYRAEVLREAADLAGEQWYSSPRMETLERRLRRMADESGPGGEECDCPGCDEGDDYGHVDESDVSSEAEVEK